MKKLLIFDAYGTLISTGSGSVGAAEKILLLCRYEEIGAKAFYTEWKKLHRRNINKSNENGFMPEREIFIEDLKELYRIYGIRRSAETDAEIMIASLYERKLYPETAGVIESLRKKYRVVIGSTTDTAPLADNLKDTGLAVDAVYTSESLGVYKPDHKFYLSILEVENCLPGDAVFIGDSLTDDVNGPKSCGITAVHIDRKRKGEASGIADYCISDLRELLTIL